VGVGDCAQAGELAKRTAIAIVAVAKAARRIEVRIESEPLLTFGFLSVQKRTLLHKTPRMLSDCYKDVITAL
jgi:hypothetical protein